MAITLYEQRRSLGLAGGCLWLVAVGTAYAAWSLLAIQSAWATSLLVATSIFAVGMYLFGIAMIRGVRQLPVLPATEPSRARRIILRFGAIVAIEGVAIAMVSLACIFTHHARFIVPLTLVIVGLHFLPLARLFDVPRYSVTGILFCIIPIVTMVAVPASAHVGQLRDWIAIPSVGCALVSLATGWGGLNEVRRFLSASQASSPSPAA